jgi:hypothetical protein
MSNPFRTTTDMTDGKTTVTTTHHEHPEGAAYCTVTVAPSTGVERNAVEVTSDADGTLLRVDEHGNGMMLDAYGRALAVALTEHYARKDANG